MISMYIKGKYEPKDWKTWGQLILTVKYHKQVITSVSKTLSTSKTTHDRCILSFIRLASIWKSSDSQIH
jgi:hypothetical protein